MKNIEKSIVIVRGERVMLDADLAKLYGVEKKRLIEAVKRNIARFPEDFMFQLKIQEVRDLKSQFATSSLQRIENTTHFAAVHGGIRKLPYVFTEHGVAMLSSILNSPRAIAVNVEIIRAFVKLRRIISEHKELEQQLSEIQRRVGGHDQQFKVVFEAIRQLMLPPEVKKRKIGFGRD